MRIVGPGCQLSLLRPGSRFSEAFPGERSTQVTLVLELNDTPVRTRTLAGRHPEITPDACTRRIHGVSHLLTKTVVI